MEALGFRFGGGGGGLKHLEFVRTFVATAFAVVSWLYQYAKQKSGRLGPCINTVESFLQAVIAPVFQKTKDLLGRALSFLDKVVDELAPASVKKVLKRANQLVNTAKHALDFLALQVKIIGPDNVVALIGTFIKKSIATLLTILGSKLRRYPVLGAVGGMIFSAFSFFSNGYNKLVTKLSTRGYPIFSKLPLIPIEDLTKAFKQIGVAPAKEDGTNIFEGLSKAFKQVGAALSDKDGKNITENLTKAFKNFLVAPEENDHGNIIEDLTKAMKQAGLAPAHKDDRNIIQDLTKALKLVAVTPGEDDRAAPAEKGETPAEKEDKNIIEDLTKAFRQVGEATAKKDDKNIIEDLTKAFRQVGEATAKKDDNNIIEDLNNAFKQVGLAPAKKDDSNIVEQLAKAIQQGGVAAEKNARNVFEGLTKAFKNNGGSTSEKEGANSASKTN